MSVVGSLAWKSALENGRSFKVPDFKKESERRKYEEKNFSPFPEDSRPGQPPVSIRGNRDPSPETLVHAREVWRTVGYHGD